ncbi:unnamed protein product (macronuclear) [Paramecium tetraurelia]|uniref:Phosphoinositide phospholipase C n=1 Tax=Paramecium tetraurelia TaxID=5888 RepID=A0CKY8_PARTE|nr:uncharacterized protein GSPATT00008002001 [Paramecium tetraurelia]CAK71455.1 unnamed protein product [Paramecium tetraurelia]|eukprot:XP_001438852.1 hypothetical protein (macronuclear) [Paramecium tetraurelia strain d4-2]
MNYSTVLSKKPFPPQKQDQAINLLVYGCEIQKITSGNKFEKLFIYMSHEVSYQLIYIINQYTNYIDLRKIRFITDDIRDSKKFTDDKSVLLQIFVSEECWYLKFANQTLKELWWQGLQYFYTKVKEDLKEKLQIQLMAWEMFIKFDEDRDGSLNKEEQQGFLNWIKLVYPNKSFIENKCIQSSFQNKLEFMQFEEIVRLLYKQSILIKLNKLYLNSQNLLIEADFEKFIRTAQRQQDTDYFFGFPMTADKFNDFLFSQQNSIFEMGHSDDMTKPLSHYYINSSHNTYLTKDQLAGDSSVGQYVIALLNGCRCFELDCWDSISDRNPVVYHGYTLTSKILFEDAILALDKFGFMFSSYPIILSLELHCSIDQQEVLGQIMRAQFKDELYIYEQNLSVLPSLDKLKRKFLIKSSGILEESYSLHKNNQEIHKTMQSQKIVKTQKTLELIQVDQDPEPGLVREIAQKQRISNKTLKNLNYENKQKQFIRHDAICDFKMIGDQIDLVIPVSMNVKHHPQFLSCISLFNSPFEINKKRSIWNISSLSEDKVDKIFKEKKVKEVQQHLNNYLVRIYPSGMRVDSSNFDPIPSFILGAQIIALNFQTKDEPMLINRARFSQNLGIGYVLKPKYLIEGLDQVTNFESPDYPKKLVTLEIISCQLFLLHTKNVINPQVIVKLKGNKVDENGQELQTNVIYNNGLNPEFDQNYSKTTFEVKDVDQAIFIFKVFNKSDDNKQTIIGQYALPFKNMREGFRAIPLKDENLMVMEYCYIFAQVTIQ